MTSSDADTAAISEAALGVVKKIRRPCVSPRRFTVLVGKRNRTPPCSPLSGMRTSDAGDELHAATTLLSIEVRFRSNPASRQVWKCFPVRLRERISNLRVDECPPESDLAVTLVHRRGYVEIRGELARRLVRGWSAHVCATGTRAGRPTAIPSGGQTFVYLDFSGRVMSQIKAFSTSFAQFGVRARTAPGRLVAVRSGHVASSLSRLVAVTVAAGR